jgi:hypothetical protein
MAKKLKSECDETSSQLDEIEITTNVSFTIPFKHKYFDINDSLEDILDDFVIANYSAGITDDSWLV